MLFQAVMLCGLLVLAVEGLYRDRRMTRPGGLSNQMQGMRREDKAGPGQF